MGLMKIRDSARVCETLRIAFGISCSVETGTFHGRTASWAEERSERVITVELLEPLYRAAAIFQHNGDPRRELARLSSSLPPAIVWLDTDCCAGPSGGMGDECPFLGEIAVLAPAWERLYVLVDDALFHPAAAAARCGTMAVACASGEPPQHGRGPVRRAVRRCAREPSAGGTGRHVGLYSQGRAAQHASARL